MTVEIEHVPRQTEAVPEFVSEPEDDDKVLGEMPERDLYQVEREKVIQEEQYVIHTVDGMGKQATTYWVEQNDNGEWEVVKRRKNPNRGHAKVKKSGELSTETVRETLQEKAGIEVIN